MKGWNGAERKSITRGSPLCKRITREILSVAPRRQHPSFFRVLGSPTAYFLYSMETIRDTPHYFLFLPIQTNFLLRELHLSIFSLASCSVFIPWLDWKSRSTVDWYKRAIFIHLQFVKFWFLFVFCTKGWIFSGGQRLLGSFPKSNTSSFTFSWKEKEWVLVQFGCCTFAQQARQPFNLNPLTNDNALCSWKASAAKI